MDEQNQIFRTISKNTDGAFMHSDSIGGQHYPQVFHWQIISTVADRPISGSQIKLVQAYFPFEHALEFKLCKGDNCLGVHDKLDCGDTELDTQYKIDAKDNNKEKVCRLVTTPSVRAKLLALDTVRIEMKRDDKKSPYVLELADWSDKLSIERIEMYIATARTILNALIPIITASPPEEGLV